MIKRKRESHTLPPLQSDIIQHLAEEGSQTINKIASGVSRSYKPTWTAFNSLVKKKLIQETDVKTWRGREYLKFWLSSNGVLIALSDGADSDRLLELVKEIYPEDQTLACYLQVFAKMNPEIIRIAYSAIITKGKLEPIDLVNIILTEKHPDPDEKLKEIVGTLKAYPKEYELFKKRMDKILESLEKLKELTRAR